MWDRCFSIFAVIPQVMVTNVTSLLKTVKAVEDEATRGTRALEATIECIKQELAVRMVACTVDGCAREASQHNCCQEYQIRVMLGSILADSGILFICHPQLFQSKDPPTKTTTPEEFIRMTKGITIATAKAVAAGNSARQEDIIHTANLSRKAMSDMLSTCKVLFEPYCNDEWNIFILVLFKRGLYYWRCASGCILASSLPSRCQRGGEEQSADVWITVCNRIHRSAGARAVGGLAAAERAFFLCCPMSFYRFKYKNTLGCWGATGSLDTDWLHLTNLDIQYISGFKYSSPWNQRIVFWRRAHIIL